MSSQYGGDENSIDFHHLMPVGSQSHRLDSGYLTFSSSFASPCATSPPRLSPSIVILNQLDSPTSDRDLHSPFVTQHFISTNDYEQYVTTRKHFDILTQLYHRNTFHLINQILNDLNEIDLQSCSNVSHRWHSIVCNYRQRQQTKNVKRNLFNNNEKKIFMKKKLTSTPMQSVTNLLETKSTIPRIIQTNETDENILPFTSSPDHNVRITASAMTFRYGYLKYLHGPTIPKRCPLCAYVSIVDVNDQHGICTNPLCGNSFCQCCSGPYHPSSPCKTTTGPIKSPWRKREAISPIFSNKTRSNLRRLLLR